MSLCSHSPRLGITKQNFVGNFEAELFAQQQNSQVRAQRMQQIRKQESELTKKKIQQSQQQQEKLKKEDEMKKKYQEYLEKKAQIESLEQAKEQSILEQKRAEERAEQYRKQQIEELEQKKQLQQYYQEQAQKRYSEAQEWKKQSFLETSQGKAIQLQNQRKEASILEKQKEAYSVQIFKEQSKNKSSSTFLQDLENYEKFDKNISRRQILKPEDFANTCFHNPQVVNHYEQEQENAMEKANITMLETQSILMEQARQRKEQEKLQKERSKKAFSKEKQVKLIEQMEQEAKFIKKQEVEQIQKTKPPIRKPKSELNHQKMLSKEFDKIFNDNNHSSIIVKDHRAKSNSPKKSIIKKQQEKERPKSVKIFTKAPLDTNLFNNNEGQDAISKQDYTEYAIGSEDNNNSIKKKVQFSDIKDSINDAKSLNLQSSTVTVTDLKDFNQQQNNNKNLTDQKSSEYIENLDQNSSQEQLQEEQEDENSQDESHQNSLSQEQQSPPPQLQSNQIQDIRQYIKQQEQYLQKLEQQRINTKQKIKEEEQNLVQSFKNTRQQPLIKHTIPEESDDDTSLQHSQIDNQSENNYQQYQQQQQFQNNQLSSPDSHELLQSSYKNTIDEDCDSNDIMQQFLQPKRNNNNNFAFQKPTLLLDNQNSIKQTIDSQQNQSIKKNQFQFNSPYSDLNYSASEMKNKTSPIKQCDFQQSPEVYEQQSSSQKKDLEYSEIDNDEQIINQPEIEETLGEIFQKRKAMLAKKMEQRQENKTIEKNGKSKEELLQIRKEMLKSKRQIEKEKNQDNLIEQQQQQQQQSSDDEMKPIEQEDKRTQLMRRLAMGEKVKIDKKEMFGLTNKNYEQLPEVRKKKDQQEKNENMKLRKQKVKEMDQKLRETLKQKRQQSY